MSDYSVTDFLSVAVMVFVVLPIGSVFAFAPHVFVRLQARFYHNAYKEVLKQGDAEIDKPYQFPWDRKLMGKRSEFLSRGLEDPKSYKQLMRYYRLFGMFILFTCSCALVFIALIAMTIL